LSRDLNAKGRRVKDSFSWWQSRIKVLKGYEKEAAATYQTNKIAYDVGPQALSKLALLAYYITVYTNIIKSNFPKAYYADLFAGSGLTRIASTGDIVMGSAMLAQSVPRGGRKFDRIILVEKDSSSAAALRQRIPSAEVVEDDVNRVDLELLLGKDTKWKIPTLGFVDPEGTQIDWARLQQLLDRWSDVIINYQVEGVRRAAGRSAEPGYAQGLTDFFGTDEWKNLKHTDEDYLQLYLKQIHKYKDYAIETRVRGKGGFFYYMILAVKKTKGGSDWVNSIYRAKEQIEKAGPDLVEQLLKVYKGEQLTLS